MGWREELRNIETDISEEEVFEAIFVEDTMI